MKFNIFGVDLEINKPQFKNFEEYWEIETDTDDFSMVSKEKYSLEFNGQEIPYRFCLLGSYIESEETEDPVWLMSLRLLPDYDLFNKKGINQIKEDYCMGKEDELYVIDIIGEFELPIIDHEQKIFKEHFSKDEEFQEYLLGIAYHCQVVSRIIAFPMDKTVNNIMTTNWDLLESILTGCNPFEKGLKRCKDLLNKKEGKKDV